MSGKSKQNAGRWLKRGLGLLIAAGLVVATVFAMLPKPVPVETATLARGPLTVSIDEDGKTRVIDHYQVSAPLGGTMARVTLAPGDSVEQGALITTIEAIEPPLLDARTRAEAEARLKAAAAAKRQASASVKRAKAASTFAQNERDRVAQLVGRGSYAQRNLDVAELDLQTRKQELESARFGVRVAQYEFEMAQATVARIDAQARRQGKKGKQAPAPDPAPTGPVVEVHSPIEGTVLRVFQEHEGVITPGTPLLELADPDALEIVVDVLTSDAVTIERGDVVHIRQWGGEQTLEGRVRLIEPSAFTKLSALGVEEQRVNVVIDLVELPEGVRLGDGYRVEVSVVVWEAEDVVLIPVSALFRTDQQWAVWTLEDDHARLRPVEIGQRQGLWVEALSGVEAGEQVIVHPSDAVVEGAEVELHTP